MPRTLQIPHRVKRDEAVLPPYGCDSVQHLFTFMGEGSPGRVDAWLIPALTNLAALHRIFDEKRLHLYELKLAA